MPRYARFFRPAETDEDHDKQLASWAALGGSQQRFVIGSMLFEIGEKLDSQAGALDKVSAAMEELASFGELLATLDEEQGQERLPREGEGEDAPAAELGDEAQSDAQLPEVA